MRRFLFSGVFFVACVLLVPSTPAHAAPTYIHEEISGDVVWTKAHGPYVVAGVIIPEGSSLTIEPGVIIKASTWAIPFQVMGGTLTVGAPDAERVIITSLFDDTVDGDTNEDGDATSPYPGHWNSIMISSGQATLTNVAIRYGNKDGLYGYGQVYNENGTVSLSHVELSLSGGVGLYGKGGVTEVYDSSFLDNSHYGIRQQGGGILRFGRNTFQGNSTAVFIQGSTTAFENSGGNSGEGNILLHSISIQDEYAVFPADGLPYYPVAVGIPVGKTLTLQPGVIVKVRGTSPFGILGTLNVGAADAEPVVFTSYADDTAGGDTNADGAATAPKRGDWGYITSNSGGVITMTNVIMRYGGSSFGTIVNQGGDITLNDVRVSESLTDIIYQQSGTLSVTNSEFSNASRGVRVDHAGGSMQIHESNFHDLTNYGITNTSSIQVDAKNNWWGDASGPWHLTHPEGLGAKLSGNIDFAPWSECYKETCPSNVLFLPGIMGSRLYYTDPECALVNCENKLWVSNRSADGEKLYMNEGVSHLKDIYAKEGDIVSTAGPLNTKFYDSFSKDMDALVSGGSLAAWKPIAYDWRYDYKALLSQGANEDGKIYYDQKLESPYIVSEFLKLAASSKTKKVTIIGHSNGGLLAKALVKKLQDMGKGDMVDKMIFVAAPQVGTPQSVGALLHGYNPSAEIKFLINAKVQRKLSHDMPMSYNLLPSSEYFDTVRKSIAEFDGDLTKQRELWGDSINTYEEEKDFLLGKDDRGVPEYENLNDPAIVDETLFDNSREWHSVFDHWTPPAGVKLYQIAGWGVDTVRGIKYSRAPWYSSSSFQYEPVVTEDGDGTVVTPSALYDSRGERYYVDLNEYKKDKKINLSHADILEIPELRGFIGSMLRNDGAAITVPAYISAGRPAMIHPEKRLRYYLHSPLTLELYDIDGHHVGYSAETDSFDLDIPGAYYNEFGEVKYISVPADIETRLIMRGQAEGRFTLNVEEVEGEIIESTTFAHIPVSASTVVTMEIPAGTSPSELSGLSIDKEGDGTVDTVLPPGTVIEDADSIAPVTTLSVSGTQGQNGWYTSDVVITLSATDNENGSGVDKTEYSLDNGTTWIAYLDPVTIVSEGITIFQYRSTDKANNQEAAKIETISIDKTAPEAKISFNPITQKLDISGTDNLSDVAVVVVDKPDMRISHKKMKNIKPWFSRWHDKHKGNLPDMLATITDQAGHTTSLSFEKTKDRRGFVFVRLLSLGYDGTETVVKDTDAQYKWRIDKKRQYQLFASSLRTGETRIESHYLPKKNETWIMEKSEGLRDDDRDEENERNERDEERAIKTRLPGMVVPYMESKVGEINIKY